MTSKLVLDNIAGRTTAGSIAVVAEGNSTTTNLQQGLTKAWCIWNKNDDSITDSFNVSGDTDNGAGNQTTSYTNNMAITKGYHAQGTMAHTSAVTSYQYNIQPREDDSVTTSSIQTSAVWVGASGAGISDRYFNTITIVGDLA
tara:strand:+ start:75 stop:503 length:429 start_codon:yes stop_codon:yes gene_type:complete